MKYEDVWGTKIVNTTTHSITFKRDGNYAMTTIPPSGTVLNAVPFTEQIKVGKVTIIGTSYEGNHPGHKFLSDLPPDNSIIVVGSIIAALAYPGKVKALIAWQGYKRLPPHERVYIHNKFRVFL